MHKHRYTVAGLARLALSQAARDASDQYRRAVPRDADRWGDSYLTDAAVNRGFDVAEVLGLAVVTERLRGVSWGDIAKQLPDKPESDEAARSYEPFVARFRDAVMFPVRHDGETPDDLPKGLDNPSRTARALDKWIVGAGGSEKRTPVKHGLVSKGFDLVDAQSGGQTPDRPAVARLMVSSSAADISDNLRVLVATAPDDGRRPGALVAQAAQIFDAAYNHEIHCIVADRMLGMTWARIAEAVGLPVGNLQAVARRYGNDFKLYFDDAGVEPPRQSPARLDGWLVDVEANSARLFAGYDTKSLVSGGLRVTNEELKADRTKLAVQMAKRVSSLDLPDGADLPSALKRLEELETSVYGRAKTVESRPTVSEAPAREPQQDISTSRPGRNPTGSSLAD